MPEGKTICDEGYSEGNEEPRQCCSSHCFCIDEGSVVVCH